MTRDFYRAFEDRFRGTADVVESRLAVYLPFVRGAAGAHPDATLVDIGCGRGEWLDLLHKSGIAARGVDVDEAMLRDCAARGLQVERADAFDFLKRLPDASQFAVTAFHFAEHLPFDQLHVLAVEAMRVLRPGGVLIIETPNPESLIVSSTDFYLDPSHRHPLPPKLLEFWADYHGFDDIRILRLQEKQDVAPDRMSIWDVLSGTSPDYALVARKPGPAAIDGTDADAVRKTYGRTLGSLALDYDFVVRELHAQTASRLEAFDRRNAAHEQHTDERLRAMEGRLHAMEERVQALDAHLRGVLASRSWRITVPLRWAAQQWRNLREMFSGADSHG